MRDGTGAPVPDAATGLEVLRWAARSPPAAGAAAAPSAAWLQCVSLQHVTGRAHIGCVKDGEEAHQRFMVSPWFERGKPHVLGDPVVVD